MDEMKFRAFLLEIGKDLNSSQLEQLKFVLKGYVASGACEEMKEVCHYFEELVRRRILTPTNLEVLKNALSYIERPDLVEKIEENQQYFADLFRAQVEDGDKNLDQGEYDEVCDNIAKTAGNLQASSRSGQNTPDVQKQLKSSIMNEYDGEIPQFTDALSNSDLLTPVPTHGKQKGDPSMPPSHPTGTQTSVKPKPCSQTGKVVPSGPALDEAESNTNEDVEMTAEEDLPGAESMNTEDELDNFDNTILKEPSESMFTDDTSGERVPLKPNMAGVNTGAFCPPAATPPNIPSHQEPEDVIETDGNEGEEGDSKKAPGDKKTTSKGAEQHDHGGARPKISQAKPEDPSGKTKQKAKEQLDEVTSTVLHGTVVDNTKSPSYGTFASGSANAKQPTESEDTGSASPTGSLNPDYSTDDFPMKDTKESEPLQGESCHPGVKKGFSNQGASGFTDYGPPGHSTPPFGSAQSHDGIPNTASQLHGLQQMFQSNPEMFAAMIANAMHSSQQPPAQLQSYNKGGYSVAISNGTLCSHSNKDKGVVMMESGTQFHIAIANNNDHAAEVDITFGGMYLGVWVVEAKRPLSNALIIEGSSWAKGRLRFFSVSDPRRELEKPNAEYFGQQPEFNGKIELEFKPEIQMLKLVVKHVWKEGTEEISMPDFKTATIDDLKREINKSYSSTGVSCLIMSGKILPKDQTMSDHALENTNEVIEVLYMKEELVIESSGSEPIKMTVDPSNISVDDVKNHIENEFKIPVLEQHLRVNGQNIDGIHSLTDVFVKSKKTPVIIVDKDRDINIEVSLPNQSQRVVEINWFARVDDLKEKLRELGIYETGDTLKFKDIEIDGEGRKQLIDLDFKANSVVTIRLQPQSSHRGFSASSIPSKSRTRGFGSGRTRGFADEDSSFTQRFRGEGDFHSAANTYRAGPEGMQHDSAESLGREGLVVLTGNEESVYNQFQEDKEEWKFSKEKAVTLTIQLIEKSTGATASSASSMRGHYSEVPVSTKYPPPVPD